MEEIATVYARSLFEVAQERNQLDLIRDQLGSFTDTLSEVHSLQVFFFSPYFSSEEKKAGLKKAVVGADPTLMSFLELLIEKHRMPVIFRARRQYDVMWEAVNRRLAVQVTSAMKLDDVVIKQIGDRIAAQTNRTVDLVTDVQPDIIGGIVIKAGNVVLDGSIRHRLEQLRKQVAKAA
jgi:F-type H+-transporting ATPase subunit delta